MKPNEYDKHISIRVDKTSGYVYFMDKTHPIANKSGKVYYHRHVCSVKLNRWLLSEEIVHHIDENKLNNDPSNLQIVTKSQHIELHNNNWNEENKRIIITKICIYCNKKFETKDDRNSHCSEKCSRLNSGKRVHAKITKEELSKLVWEIPTVKIAEQLNCSDVAINKLCKKWDISKPPRGYWAKKYAKI